MLSLPAFGSTVEGRAAAAAELEAEELDEMEEELLLNVNPPFPSLLRLLLLLAALKVRRGPPD